MVLMVVVKGSHTCCARFWQVWTDISPDSVMPNNLQNILQEATVKYALDMAEMAKILSSFWRTS